MNILKVSILALVISVILSACGHTGTENKTRPKEDPVKFQKIAINDCIKRIVYIEHKTDVDKYDSISCLYFHELEEYIEPEAIAMSKELDSLKKLLSEKELLDASLYYKQIDSLRAELSPYHKFVVGYAFVHTFYDGKDTVSAIFVMDTLCGFGEMTLIKDKINVDPIDNSTYSGKIKKGKNQ